MSFSKSDFIDILVEELSEISEQNIDKLEVVLEKLLDQLRELDLSIDYMASTLTGDDPLSLGVSQSALGRLARTKQAKVRTQETKLKLQDIVKEVISESEQDRVKLGTKGMTQGAQAGELRSQAKSVQSGEIGADFTNIERSLVQQVSDVITKIASAPDVDLGKHRGQLNTVLNRLKDMTGAEFK